MAGGLKLVVLSLVLLVIKLPTRQEPSLFFCFTTRQKDIKTHTHQHSLLLSSKKTEPDKKCWPLISGFVRDQCLYILYLTVPLVICFHFRVYCTWYLLLFWLPLLALLYMVFLTTPLSLSTPPSNRYYLRRASQPKGLQSPLWWTRLISYEKWVLHFAIAMARENC